MSGNNDTSPSSKSDDNSDKKKKGPGIGTIIGISLLISVVLFGILGIAVLYLFFRERKLSNEITVINQEVEYSSFPDVSNNNITLNTNNVNYADTVDSANVSNIILGNAAQGLEYVIANTGPDSVNLCTTCTSSTNGTGDTNGDTTNSDTGDTNGGTTTTNNCGGSCSSGTPLISNQNGNATNTLASNKSYRITFISDTEYILSESTLT